MEARTENLARLAAALGSLAGADHPLGSITTYRVGGPARLFAEPADEDELLAVARAVSRLPVPVLVLGRGSNLLVADAGFDGLVVAPGTGFDDLSVEGMQVRAGASVTLPVLARRTAAAGLSGLEWAVGVPGSVGGAIRMNAGGHGSDTAATLVRYRWVDLAAGTVSEAAAGRLAFGYRSSAVAPTEVVVSGVHRLVPGDPLGSKAVIDDIVRWRREHQPGGANAGSVFTNPPDDSAGRLIEACGLKGLRIGSAEVSTKHANFIQADPGGRAADVVQLIDQVRQQVAGATGIMLHTEIRMVGFPSADGGRR